MRISTVLGDSGYVDPSRIFNIKVYFNDVVINNCVTADEENGYVICYETDADGNYILDESLMDISKVTRRGKVKVAIG